MSLRLLIVVGCVLSVRSQTTPIDEETLEQIRNIFDLNNGPTVTPSTAPTTLVDDAGNDCKCVPYYLCDPATNTTYTDGAIDGFGMLDVRFGEERCQQSVEVCCKAPRTEPIPVKPRNIKGCGVRNRLGVDFELISPAFEAEIFEFPWVAAILKVSDSRSVCAGTLIHPRVVLTGAHCIRKHPANEIKIRAGEWDTQTTKERLPYQERLVDRYIVHPRFHPKTLANDVGLMILKAPVEAADNVGMVCLPNQDENFEYAEDCISTGWGKKNFGAQGLYSVIMKKIQLNAVDYNTCLQQFRRTRLGPRFTLDRTFMCAGGEEGVDVCEGDGGAPLVCPTTNDRYKQAGIVAWGIGCGTKDVPGAYAYVSRFRNWIDQEMNAAGFGTESYTWNP